MTSPENELNQILEPTYKYLRLWISLVIAKQNESSKLPNAGLIQWTGSYEVMEIRKRLREILQSERSLLVFAKKNLKQGIDNLKLLEPKMPSELKKPTAELLSLCEYIARNIPVAQERVVREKQLLDTEQPINSHNYYQLLKDELLCYSEIHNRLHKTNLQAMGEFFNKVSVALTGVMVGTLVGAGVGVGVGAISAATSFGVAGGVSDNSASKTMFAGTFIAPAVLGTIGGFCISLALLSDKFKDVELRYLPELLERK